MFYNNFYILLLAFRPCYQASLFKVFIFVEPGVFSFSKHQYYAEEGRCVLTVQRSKGCDGTVTLQYKTMYVNRNSQAKEYHILLHNVPLACFTEYIHTESCPPSINHYHLNCCVVF